MYSISFFVYWREKYKISEENMENWFIMSVLNLCICIFYTVNIKRQGKNNKNIILFSEFLSILQINRKQTFFNND